jgi:hypothetical protein
MTTANSTSILKGSAIRSNKNWIELLRSRAVFGPALLVRLRAIAPYALIELILPGGSVMALLLWLYRRRMNGARFGPLWMRFFAWLKLANPLANAARCIDRGL